MASKPKKHFRDVYGKALCGRAPKQNQLTAEPNEVTCTYCQKRMVEQGIKTGPVEVKPAQPEAASK